MGHRPRTNGGPHGLNDGNWHNVVFANYGDTSRGQGFMNRLVVSVDGGPLTALSAEGTNPGSRAILSWRKPFSRHII